MKRLIPLAAPRLWRALAAFPPRPTSPPRPPSPMRGPITAVSFQVGHGCADKYATTALRMEIPADSVARPQPKPGWTLAIDKAADGKVVAITWRGRLEPDQYRRVRHADPRAQRRGALLFPAIQTCETGENRWVDPPAAMGDKPSATPAPMINILAAPAAMESHNHAQ